MFHKDSSGEYLEQRLQSGTARKYRRRRVLGKGGFAKCYEVTDEESNLRYACKVIDKELLSQSHMKQKLHTEIEIHRKLSHPNIVKFQRVFEDEKFIYILLELCSNNTLNELLKRRKVLTEVQVRFYMQQLLSSLKYLHKLKIVHRDLKLENFFLGDNLDIKIGDFGLAADASHKPRKTICGTPNYIAPEVLESKNGYNIEVDVWSLGVSAYLLLYGHYPFESCEPKNIANRINAKTYLINPCLSDISKSFISRMLQVKPHDRWTVKQLLDHEFLTYFEIPKALPRSSLACPLNSNFLEQFKSKKAPKVDLKDDEEFIFMLESRESHSSPRAKPSTSNQSLSASKILQISKLQNLPYIFSQKKVCSFHQCNQDQARNSCQSKLWLIHWWQNPKHGLLYQLSDSTFGMRFHDGSNLKAHPYPRKYSYTPAQGKEQLITVNKIREGKLQRGVLCKVRTMSQMMEKVGGRGEDGAEGVSVRMYLHSMDMFLVWLSNGDLQCRFEDKSDLILGKQICLYINPSKIKIFFDSQELADQNEEIIEKQKKIAIALKSIKRGCGVGNQNIVMNG